jgi:hypothetical protein
MKRLALVLLLSLVAVSAYAQDGFDLRSAVIVNSPDVRGWPVTATITGVAFDGATSRIAFSPDVWPDAVPHGFAGPINWTWWLFRQINGQWVGAGFILRWRGQNSSGSESDPDVPSVYHAHWFYADRWNPLHQAGPIRPGELLAFMVTAGAARDNTGPYPVQERSNVVVFPATDRGTFPPFGGAPPAPTPPGPPPPPPTPPAPVPALDLSGVYAQFAALNAKVDVLTNKADTTFAEAHATREDIANARSAVEKVFGNRYVQLALTALASEEIARRVTK